MMTTPCQHQNLRESYYGYTCADCGEFYCAYGQEPWADGDVWRLEPGRKREWHGRRSNWERSFAARRIANPRTLPSDWDRQEVQRRVEGERV